MKWGGYSSTPLEIQKDWRKDMNEKMRLALLKLLNVNNLRFWGLLVYNFDFIDGTMDPRVETMCVRYYRGRWEISYNAKFVDTQEVEELIYIIIHEIVHAISGHCGERGNTFPPGVWHLAIDHVTNVNLDYDVEHRVYETYVHSPKGRFIIKRLVESDPDMTAEEVAVWLSENAKIEFAPPFIHITLDGQTHSFPIDFEITLGAGAAATETATNNLVSQARAHVQSKGRGLLGGKMSELLNDLLEVSIPPEILLENAIKNQVVVSDNRSWSQVNKFWFPHGIIAPAPELGELLGDLYAAVDYSGSISKHDAALFGGAIKNCMGLFNNLHLVKHDYHILDKKLMNKEEVITSGILLEMLGRGGTSHKEVFDHIQELVEESTELSLVVLFTDWDSDIESIWDDYTWHKSVPVVHAVPRGSGRRHDIRRFGIPVELYEKR